MKKIYNDIQHTLAFLLLMIATACEDFVTIEPPQTTLSTTTVFQDESTARAAVNRIYIDMVQYTQSFSSGITSLNNMGGLASDEFYNYDSFNDMAPFASNEVTPFNSAINAAWNQIYNLIYQANAILDGLEKSNLSANARGPLEGEAHFMRAYLHFLLVSYWGDVPWIETTDYNLNTKASRTLASQVLGNIISDLLLAKEKLPAESTLRIRPTKSATAALLARVYLSMGNYLEAEQQATEVINQFPLESDLNTVFLIGSVEIIFQLQSIVPGFNTWDGDTYIILSTPQTVVLTSELINTFEPIDMRKAAWTNSYSDGTETWYYPFKYKVRRLPNITSEKTEYQVVLRSAEQYLIRAEARVNLDNLSAAITDLNMIRSRAGLPTTLASTKAELLLAIEQERRVELFSENGHRWLDLKRTGRLDAVIGTSKPEWQSTDALFPIPQNERNRNSNLSQNPGY
ncbi:MAG TPA: RagB/SusD family nutrient uptake outer membrane protein [Cyclobacteriaceae bacterium]|nr:RagB/SusD family nutrient uptake outer membrane protein [Cyclobacteriaceae bacterium]HRF32391.1 RagB/SusD family nutrient uptake outer membrane protein [Cyclobacteriaceae bacterium]